MLFRFIFVVLFCCSCAGNAPHRPSPDQSAETVRWFAARYGLAKDPALTEFLDRMQNRLSAAALQLSVSNDRELKCRGNFQVTLLETPAVAALSAGNGRIVVTRGLLRELETESQLAAVLAHEISHSLLGHHIAAGSEALHPHLQVSAADEFAADILSIELLQQAGYDASSTAAALHLFYRAIAADVSKEDARLIEARLGRLQSALYARGHSLFTTRNSREFMKLR